MKRIMGIFILMIMLIFTLTACGNKSTTTTTDTGEEKEHQKKVQNEVNEENSNNDINVDTQLTDEGESQKENESDTVEKETQDKVENENDNITDMLDGKLTDEEVTVSGEVFVNGYDESYNLTTVQIYPKTDDKNIIITAYYEGKLETEIKEGNKVLLKGTCKGKMDTSGLGEYKAIGLLLESIEKLSDN